MSITPYYASLIEKENYRNDPIFKQAFPDPAELKVSRYELSDPLHEDEDSPVEGITHRYPDRVLFLVRQPLFHVLQALHTEKKGR